MPPKARITRDMIVDAGLAIVRERGIDSVNARTISEMLGCSTQPVMYYFKKIEDIKRAIYQKADDIHTAYITDMQGEEPMLCIGLAYIRFAQTEKNLFRLLFQTNGFTGKSISELTAAPELTPVITVLSKTADVSSTQAGRIFRSLFLFVHGYASMFANNVLDYNEEEIARDLKRMLYGVLSAVKEEIQ